MIKAILLIDYENIVQEILKKAIMKMKDLCALTKPLD